MSTRDRAFSRHPVLAVGALLTCLMGLLCALSLIWTPYEPSAIDVVHKLMSPSLDHWLGTDHFGRDVASMIMVGARNSIGVASLAVAIGLCGGGALGIVAALRRGWVEELVMRLTDLTFAFPALLTAVLVSALNGPGAINVVLAIGIFNVCGICAGSAGRDNSASTSPISSCRLGARQDALQDCARPPGTKTLRASFGSRQQSNFQWRFLPRQGSAISVWECSRRIQVWAECSMTRKRSCSFHRHRRYFRALPLRRSCWVLIFSVTACAISSIRGSKCGAWDSLPMPARGSVLRKQVRRPRGRVSTYPD